MDAIPNVAARSFARDRFDLDNLRERILGAGQGRDLLRSAKHAEEHVAAMEAAISFVVIPEGATVRML